MSIQKINLVTNKEVVNLQDIVIRQSEKGLVITAVFLNEDSSPYDLTNKSVTFKEHKGNDKYVVDTGVTVTDARQGMISYKLHDQCYAATGEAWFEISNSDGTVVDSTQNFNMRVLDDANASVYNSNYISQLNSMLDQMQSIVDSANGKLQSQLTQTAQTLQAQVATMKSAFDQAQADRNTVFVNSQTSRDNDWKSDKARIDQDWVNDKARIDADWNSEKQSIQSSADSQRSGIDSAWGAIRDKANSQLSAIQNNINALQKTIDDINSGKVPNLNQQVQAVQAKVDKLNSSMGAIDWSSFVKSVNGVKPDASGNVTVDTYSKSDIDAKVASAGKVKTVNGQQPDGNGNIAIDINDKMDIVYGNANEDILGFRNIHQIRIWNGNAQNLKNLPFSSNWVTAIIYMNSNWGWVQAFSQDNKVWTNYCNGDTWTGWTKNVKNTDFDAIVNLSDNIGRVITSGNKWTDIFGANALDTSKSHLSIFKVDNHGYVPYVLGYDSSGIGFGSNDTKGLLIVNWMTPQAMITGGNADSPKWAREIAWKDDISTLNAKIATLTAQVNALQAKLGSGTVVTSSDGSVSNIVQLSQTDFNAKKTANTLDSKTVYMTPES